MKNNELRDLLQDLNVTTPDTPQFEQRLRRSLLNADRKASFGTRVRAVLTFKKDPFLRTKRAFVGLSSFALILVLVFSFVTYTYRFSPKAAAEQVINNGLVTIQATPPAQLAILQGQLGDDPAAALKEAKAAKDVTVITKDEYLALSKSSAGVLATSLNSDPNAPKTASVSISGGAPNSGVTAVYGTTIAGSANAVPSGVSSSAAPTMVTTTNGGSTVSSDGTTVSSGVVYGSGTITAMASGPVSSVPSTSTSSGPSGPGAVGATVYATGGAIAADGSGPVTTQVGTNGKALPAPTAEMVKAMQDFKPVEPSKYLKYTDPNGRTVVLSLDAKGLPIFKTIFMTAKEAQNLHP